jgi:hypothetical protein
LQCILETKGAQYASLDGCDLHNPKTWTIESHDNRIYVPGASAVVTCGSTVTVEQWQQATGKDAATSIFDAATSGQIIAWAKDVLGF